VNCSAVTDQTEKPNVSVTPGVIITIKSGDVCTPGWSLKHRISLTSKQEKEVLVKYGYSANQAVAQWDHYFSLELGGGNTELNIWPVISLAQAKQKDRLENKLHALVCGKTKLDLQIAQVEERYFWEYW